MSDESGEMPAWVIQALVRAGVDLDDIVDIKWNGGRGPNGFHRAIEVKLRPAIELGQTRIEITT